MATTENSKVIIIDSTSKTRSHIAGIMEFMGYEAIPVSDPEKWQNHYEKNEGTIMVVLGDCGSSKDQLS